MSTNDSSDWKEKYLHHVEQLEQRERDWIAFEKILRQAISRLALAVETPDRLLSEQLEQLRKAIRKNATASQVSMLMEEISSSMLRIDQQQSARTDAIAATLTRLDQRLQQLHPPAELKAPIRQLRKSLRAARKSSNAQSAIEATAEFVQVMGEWLETPEHEKKSEGLLKRLFGGGETDEHPAQLLIPEADDATSEPLAEAQHAPEVSAEEEQAAPALLPAPPAQNSTQHEALEQARQELPAFNQVLNDLMHRLDLPDALSNLREQVIDLLNQPPIPETAPRAITEIADLLAKARHHIEQEKQEIEDFLSQLTGRLQELDKYVEDRVGYREETVKEGQDIDARMSQEVAGMRRSVDEAQDIHQLKGSIQEHINSIQLHMDARARLEQDRMEEAATEIQHLKQELNKVQEESYELRTRLREARNRALRDGLTGLYNRLAYDEHIALECERWTQHGRPAVLSIWDVDFFKRINDNYGHSAGDKVLCILAKLLSKSTRETDFLARFGGEEFMMLLPETSIEEAFEVAEKLRTLVASSRFQYRGQRVPVTMSCGLAEFIENDTPDLVYRRADIALYEAKRSGRNCCKIYGESARVGAAAADKP